MSRLQNRDMWTVSTETSYRWDHSVEIPFYCGSHCGPHHWIQEYQHAGHKARLHRLVNQAGNLVLAPPQKPHQGQGFKFSQSRYLVTNMIKQYQSKNRNRINKLMTAHLHSIGLSSIPITGRRVIYGWDGLNLVLHWTMMTGTQMFPEMLVNFNQLDTADSPRRFYHLWITISNHVEGELCERISLNFK
jgi:hypothetical protein